MRIFANNEFNMDIIKEILNTYYLATDIPIFFMNELGNVFCSANEKPKFCKLFEEFTQDSCPCSQSHLYASKQSEVLGDSYVFFCPAGLIHYTVSVVQNKIFRGAFIAGPILMNYPDEIMVDGIIQKYAFSISDRADILFSLKLIPVIDPSKVHYLSKLLFYVVSNFLDEEKGFLYKRREKSLQQSHISNVIQNMKSQQDKSLYPYESEKELLTKIKHGDIIGAKSILNDIIGEIFFTSGGSIEDIKKYIIELCALLSRAAIEDGANSHKVFNLKNNYMDRLHNLNTLEDVSYWTINILNSFTDSVFNLGESKYSKLMKKALVYINNHYNKHITLDEVANLIHLSSSYFSSLFKREVGVNFSKYLNQVRIEESKKLLKDTDYSILQIAMEVGFEDQSYFTKVFKNNVGITPKEFRRDK